MFLWTDRTVFRKILEPPFDLLLAKCMIIGGGSDGLRISGRQEFDRQGSVVYHHSH